MLRKARLFESFRDLVARAATRRPVVFVDRGCCTGSIRSRPNCSPSLIDSLQTTGPALLTHRPHWEQPFGERPYYTDVRLAGSVRIRR